MSKIRFLHVKKEFIDFLKNVDTKVQNNYDDNQHQKPYISGIQIEINGRNYLAPLTSYKEEKYANMEEKTIFKITKYYKKDKQTKCFGVVLLNNMIPIVDGVYENINFREYDKKYQNLLQNQYRILSSLESISKINKIANFVYNEVTEKNSSHFKEICCDFRKLEEAITLKKFIGANPLQSPTNFNLL